MANEIASGIYLIDTKPLGNEQLISSYLISGMKNTALVDPGFPSSADTVLAEIESAGVNPENLDYIILTHTHIDHAGSAGIIARIAKKAKVVTHRRGLFYLENSVKIGGGSQMIFGNLSIGLGQPVDVSGERILTVEDGSTIELGGKSIQVFYTPGHCGDHVSLLETETGTLFTGDVSCLHYPQLGHVLIPAGSPPIYRSDYIINELERFSKLEIKNIATPHYGMAAAAPSDYLRENIRAVRDSKKKIDRMFRDGFEFPQVVEKLRHTIIEESGKPAGDIPDFLAGTWLPIMLRTGLMGFMADILEYARDIRPFTNFETIPA